MVTACLKQNMTLTLKKAVRISNRWIYEPRFLYTENHNTENDTDVAYNFLKSHFFFEKEKAE